MTMARISVVCASTGTISRRARPTSSEVRDNGETSSRSCEPVNISCISDAPTIDDPIRQDMATMPGTNHWSAEVVGPMSGSRGANSARKTSGCISEISMPNGSRRSGLSSRVKTLAVSVTRVVWVLMLRLLRQWRWRGRWSRSRRRSRPRAGSSR